LVALSAKSTTKWKTPRDVWYSEAVKEFVLLCVSLAAKLGSTQRVEKFPGSCHVQLLSSTTVACKLCMKVVSNNTEIYGRWALPVITHVHFVPGRPCTARNSPELDTLGNIDCTTAASHTPAPEAAEIVDTLAAVVTASFVSTSVYPTPHMQSETDVLAVDRVELVVSK